MKPSRRFKPANDSCPFQLKANSEHLLIFTRKKSINSLHLGALAKLVAINFVVPVQIFFSALVSGCFHCFVPSSMGLMVCFPSI